MNKYSFRLNNVLRVRRVQEEIAKSDLLKANTEVQSAIAVVEKRLTEYTDVNRSPRGAVTVDGFMRQRYFNELAGKAVIAARASHASANAEASIKRAAFTGAARKTKALDRLNDRSREEYALESQRDSDREMDEIATGRAVSGRNGSFRRPVRTALGTQAS